VQVKQDRQENRTVNPAGSPRIIDTTPRRDYKREDFLRDLEKVVKKLPPDHPSRSGSQKR
jgi:hypothetical protein